MSNHGMPLKRKK
uniref:Uncharacterized protein n=1 Tax=Arundo donax TaxID=35708 RepID=A0A0A9F1V3_ARUDO